MSKSWPIPKSAQKERKLRKKEDKFLCLLCIFAYGSGGTYLLPTNLYLNKTTLRNMS